MPSILTNKNTGVDVHFRLSALLLPLIVVLACHRDKPDSLPDDSVSKSEMNEASEVGIVVFNNGHSQFKALADNSREITMLQDKPVQIESELKKGGWIVFVGATWSVNDFIALKHFMALPEAVADAHCGEVSFGVRPFGDYEELFGWLPRSSVKSVMGSMFLVVLRDGEVIEFRSGVQELEDMVQVYKRAFCDEKD